MRTLVVRMDSAGDVLLAGPAVRAAAASSDEVLMLCGTQGRAAARLLPGVDDVVVWDAPWVGFQAPALDKYEVHELLDTLAEAQIDRALILVSFHQSPLPAALVLRLAGVEWIGADSTDYPGTLLDLRHHRAPGRHEAQAALDLALAAGYRLPPRDDGRLHVRPPPDVRDLTGPDPYVVVHPGASVPARAPSPETARRAVAELAGAGRRVLVTGTPEERALTAEVAGSHAWDLGGRTDLAHLAGVLAGADAVVVGNTGPAHLAAAVGTPVVSLFSPVVPATRWRPYGVPCVLLGDQHAACAGTRARTCPVPGHPCLDALTGERIRDAVDLLAPDPGGRPASQDHRPPIREAVS